MNRVMTQDFRQAVELLREGRAVRFAEKLLNKASHLLHSSLFFYDRFFILHLRVQPGRPSPLRGRLGGIVVRPVTPADDEPLQKMAPRSDAYAARRADGSVGLIADDGSRAAGMIWIKQTAVHYEDDVEFPVTLPPNSLWQFDLYVDPAYRLRGVWILLEEAVTAYASARGITDLFGLTKALNAPSVNAHLRYTYEIVEEIISLRVLGLRMYVKWRHVDGRRIFGGMRLRLKGLPRTGDPFGRLLGPGERHIGNH